MRSNEESREIRLGPKNSAELLKAFKRTGETFSLYIGLNFSAVSGELE